MTRWFNGSLLCVLLLSSSPLCAQQPQFIVTMQDDIVHYDPATGVGSGLVRFFIEEIPGSPTFPNTVTTWSVSLFSDPTLVDTTHVELGAYLATVNNGGPPQSYAWNLNVDGFTFFAIYNFSGLTTCSYDVPKEVLRVRYETVPSAWAGNQTGGTVPLVWMPLGIPGTDNLIAYSVPGVSTGSVPFTSPNGVLAITPDGAQLIRGDGDGDGAVSAITDAVSILGYLFLNGSVPCLDAADVNDDGTVNLLDPVHLLNWGFVQGPPPAAPFPSCGIDSTPSPLTCLVSPVQCP